MSQYDPLGLLAHYHAEDFSAGQDLGALLHLVHERLVQRHKAGGLSPLLSLMASSHLGPDLHVDEILPGRVADAQKLAPERLLLFLVAFTTCYQGLGPKTTQGQDLRERPGIRPIWSLEATHPGHLLVGTSSAPIINEGGGNQLGGSQLVNLHAVKSCLPL